jgi:hypothetical protein
MVMSLNGKQTRGIDLMDDYECPVSIEARSKRISTKGSIRCKEEKREVEIRRVTRVG